MRKTALTMMSAAVVICGAVPALAQSGRTDSRALSCAQARATVAANGSIVLGTGRHTYDRYVANERFCPPHQMAKRATVPTRDSSACLVGYRCVLDTEREDRRWWLRRR